MPVYRSPVDLWTIQPTPALGRDMTDASLNGPSSSQAALLVVRLIAYARGHLSLIHI